MFRLTLVQVLWGVAAGLGVAAVVGLARASGRPRLPTLVVGDSLAVGLGQALARRLPGQVMVDAQVGEPPATTLALMPQRLREHPEARSVVVWTGANRVDSPGGAVVQTTLAVQAAAETGRRVLVVALPPSPRLGENGRIFNSGLPYSVGSAGAVVQVPAGVEIAGDGLHLTATGYATVAEAVARRY
jgi:hypothetical protein